MKQMKKHTKKQNTSYAAKRGFLLLLTVVLILGIGTLVFGGQKKVETKVHYQTVQIHSGDTLWKIAQTYRLETEKTEQMVEDILTLNSMKNTNIQSGQRIIVPVRQLVY